jgi:hypothetical protein
LLSFHPDKVQTYQNGAGIFAPVQTLPALHVLTGEKSMFRTFIIAPAAAAVLALSSTAFAKGQGTPDEAEAMLAK